MVRVHYWLVLKVLRNLWSVISNWIHCMNFVNTAFVIVAIFGDLKWANPLVKRKDRSLRTFCLNWYTFCKLMIRLMVFKNYRHNLDVFLLCVCDLSFLKYLDIIVWLSPCTLCPWNIHTVSKWIHVIYCHVFLRVTSLALGKLHNFSCANELILGIYLLKRRRLTAIGVLIINLRQSNDRLKFMVWILIPIRQCSCSE